MPVYKSSPERTRRLFGSGLIVARPPRQGSAQSNARYNSEEKRLQRSRINAAGAPLLTQEQAVELREIFLERGTEFYYADAFRHSQSNFDEGENMMTDLVARAEQYARQHHKGQRRKGEAAEPYITHVHEVALLVSNFGGDDIAVAGAWLHDVVEDCTPTLDDVIKEFGDEVAALVAEVTDDKALEKADRKARQVETAVKKSDRACLIKWADKTSNLRAIALSPPPWPEARKREYIAWASTVTNALPFRPDNAVALFEEAKGLALTSI